MDPMNGPDEWTDEWTKWTKWTGVLITHGSFNLRVVFLSRESRALKYPRVSCVCQ